MSAAAEAAEARARCWRVRPARPGDAEAMRAIYNDAVATTTATMDTEPRSAEQQAAWMAAHGEVARYPALVAEEAPAGGRVVGWAALSPYNPKPGYATTAEVSVYVDAAARGRGVGGALLRALVEEGRRRGFVTLVALITSDNLVSLRLHARHGFGDVGTLGRVARKFDRWVDVTILQKHLDADRDG
jgi:phosphinothricin acetyltransferase